MASFKDPIDMYSELSEIQMHPERDEKIRSHIEHVLKTGSSSSVRQRRFRRLGPLGAACVGVLLVVAGVYTVEHQEHNSVPISTTAKESGFQVHSAAEVVTPNWRLVIVKSLFKPGPFYDVQVYYEGHKPISNYTVKWNGSQVTPGGQSVQPGTLLSGFDMVSLPQGLVHTSPFEITWFGTDGRKHTEILNLSKAKFDLRVENYHEYEGQGKQWNVSYAFESIAGKSFHEPYGLLKLNFEGENIGNSVHYTLRSTKGTEQMMFYNPHSPIQIDPGNKGRIITDSQATITIQWKGETETIPLTKLK